MIEQTVPRPAQIQQLAFRAMGSQILAAIDGDETEGTALLAQVPAWFEEWEQSLSRFRDDSELSRINRTAGSAAPVPVSDTFWAVLQQALQAAQHTGGLVTPTVLNALEAAGYRTSFDTLRHAAHGVATPTGTGPVAAPPSIFTRWREIELHPETQSVRLPAGVRLDFGGTAKGWAVDEALRRLAPHGPALVNAGGDIAVSGPTRDGAGWPIGVDAPLGLELATDSQLELLDIRGGGVATSGRDYRRWQQNGTWQHHIIDPRSGVPADTDVLAATVIGPTASDAEIAAKVALLLGGAEGLRWLEAQPGLAGLLVLETGQVTRSRRFADYVWSSEHGT